MPVLWIRDSEFWVRNSWIQPDGSAGFPAQASISRLTCRVQHHCEPVGRNNRTLIGDQDHHHHRRSISGTRTCIWRGVGVGDYCDSGVNNCWNCNRNWGNWLRSTRATLECEWLVVNVGTDGTGWSGGSGGGANTIYSLESAPRSAWWFAPAPRGSKYPDNAIWRTPLPVPLIVPEIKRILIRRMRCAESCFSSFFPLFPLAHLRYYIYPHQIIAFWPIHLNC